MSDWDRAVSWDSQGLDSGDWGCNQLEQVVNKGADVLLAPMRISTLAMSIGDMQRRYLTRRDQYALLTGPERSRVGLSELEERPRRRFTNRLLALSPPLVLQSRFKTSKQGGVQGDDAKCLLLSSAEVAVPPSAMQQTLGNPASLLLWFDAHLSLPPPLLCLSPPPPPPSLSTSLCMIISRIAPHPTASEGSSCTYTLLIGEECVERGADSLLTLFARCLVTNDGIASRIRARLRNG